LTIPGVLGNAIDWLPRVDKVMIGNEIYVVAVHTKMDEAGNITDEATVAFLDAVADNFEQWMERFR